ncbi:MAG: (2Fe-2S)-binding protein [Hydrogenophilales bacterium 28-61-23]|nr:MAG: (2Fe-2S)-binding protein [Hydrogenophilales bacterium 28-61-23]
MDLKRYWWPLATQTELDAGKPLARSLHGVPLVLFRDAANHAAALLDRCPHRHAPLSRGKIRQGELQCPYHGWRFATDGRCTAVPGMDHETGAKPLIPSFATRIEHGLVWACTHTHNANPDATTPEPVAPAVLEDVDWFFMTDTVQCGIAEAAENFLDGFHTHFVHAGWIRRDSKRQTVKASVHRLADGVEARYHDEGLQSGLISSLLEGDRQASMGRFRLPGIAEIEYRGRRGLNLLVTAWLTPECEGRLRIHARIATRRGLAPAWLKRALLRRLFAVILRQDKTILERTHANIEQCEKAGLDAPLLDSRLDLLGPSIRSLLLGQPLKLQNDEAIYCRL